MHTNDYQHVTDLDFLVHQDILGALIWSFGYKRRSRDSKLQTHKLDYLVSD